MGDGDLEQFGEFSGVPVLLNFFSVISGLLIMLGVKLEIDPISDIESILLDIKLRVDPPCICLSFKTKVKPKFVVEKVELAKSLSLWHNLLMAICCSFV